MYFRSILSGTLAAFLLFGPAQASDRSQPAATAGANLAVPLPDTALPGVFSSAKGATTQLAQATDPRVGGLEDQIRSLNGTVEELNFQILQMQEQLRKMQEDNEFRFQELENNKKSDATPGKTNKSVAENSATPSPGGPAEADVAAAPSGEAERGIGSHGSSQTTADANAPGTPPKSFGTITFDASGNVTGGSIGDQIAADAAAAPTGGETEVAALPATDDPDELYRNSYQFILSGDYGTAETGFRDHMARFPNDPKAADSQFWLGEALLGQQKYRDAAEVFLAANKAHPKSKKAPEMLLKLGISLVGLNQRDVACATFGEIGKRYPNLSSALKDRVKQEQARAAC